MTETMIPSDVRDKADTLAQRWVPRKLLSDEIAAALMAEREHCAKIAETEFARGFPIAAAIRAGKPHG